MPNIKPEKSGLPGMRNIKLVLQYDGTSYRGWQSQRGGGTVQQELEKCIGSVTGGEEPKLIGAGRTDSGVHALGQAASFRTSSELPADTLRRALNAVLPRDIRVLSCEDAAADFHARHHARGKVYFYNIAAMAYAPVFFERFMWRVPARLGLPPMVEAAGAFLGRRDFRAMMGAGSAVKDTVREIRAVDITESSEEAFLGTSIKGRFIRITVEGDGFLRHMVRNIVGTLADVGKGAIEPESVRDIIESGQRGRAGPTAPARGLFLKEVLYG